MAHAIQRRRGTTAEHSTFTGLAGELTVDTDKNVVVVHDGKTPGGHPNAPANHNHDGAYAPVSHPHPELAATPADVQGGTGDGFVKAKDLKDASVNHAVTAGSATSAQEATTAQSAGNADTVDSYHASTTPMAQAIPVAGPSGKLDAGWIPPMADVDATTLKGKIPSVTPQANAIPIAGADGKLASGWFESVAGQNSGYVYYGTPGTYEFVVPQGVSTVYVEVQGAGGGGGGSTNEGSAGTQGGSSSFGAYITATGGAGGPRGSGVLTPAARGTVSGDNVLREPFFCSDGVGTKGGGGGGSRYAPGGPSVDTFSGNTPIGGAHNGYGTGSGGYGGHGGGAGGNGVARVTNLTPGQRITVVVGAGGEGGISTFRGGRLQPGAPGFVRIWW